MAEMDVPAAESIALAGEILRVEWDLARAAGLLVTQDCMNDPNMTAVANFNDILTTLESDPTLLQTVSVCNVIHVDTLDPGYEPTFDFTRTAVRVAHRLRELGQSHACSAPLVSDTAAVIAGVEAEGQVLQTWHLLQNRFWHQPSDDQPAPVLLLVDAAGQLRAVQGPHTQQLAYVFEETEIPVLDGAESRLLPKGSFVELDYGQQDPMEEYRDAAAVVLGMVGKVDDVIFHRLDTSRLPESIKHAAMTQAVRHNPALKSVMSLDNTMQPAAIGQTIKLWISRQYIKDQLVYATG